MKSRRTTILLSIIAVLIFVISLLMGVMFYKIYIPLNTFLPNTYINGIEVSKLGPTNVYNVLKKDMGVSVNIRINDKIITTINAEDLGYNDYSAYYIQEIIDNQRKGLSVSSLFKVTDYTVRFLVVPDTIAKSSYSEINERNEIIIYNLYDEKKLRDKLENLQLSKNKSQNAQMIYSSDENKYKIIDEIYGTEVDIEIVFGMLKEAIEQGKTEIDISSLIEKPDIISTDKKLNEMKDKLNALLNVELVYDFGDRQEPINSNLIKNWLIIEDDNVDFDVESIKDYLRAISKIYDTFGKTREFNSTTKGAIKVSGGSYGWMIHLTNSANKLIEYIKEGKSGLIQPEYSYKAKIRDTNDIGDTYIEISLDDQMVWLYEKGELVLESQCVTGNLSKGWGTKKGVYPILYKQRNATLKGQGYSSPVSYWMPFDTNVGLHDASWRDKFGGTIYKTNGSHGCVNLPSNIAKELYNHVYEGMPVIVY